MISLAMGSVPKPGQITDDTALYQNLSEIRVRKQKAIDFDADIAQLSKMEPRFREKLPAVSVVSKDDRLKGPTSRIAKMKYRYSGGSNSNIASKKRARVVRQ